MITYILQVTICWGLFLALYHFSLRKETFFAVNRAYLILTIALGLLIPRVTWDSSMFMQQETLGNAVYLMSTGFDQVAAVITPEKEFISFSNPLLLLYAFIVGLLLAKLLFGILKIYTLKRNAQIEYWGDKTIAYTQKDHAPFTFFGTIFLSKARNELDNDPAILIHEAAHVSGWHTLDVLFVELIKVFFWFNPLVYIYDNAIKNIHEYIADANVLKRTAFQKYGRLLLRQAQPGLEIALANHFYNHQLKKRFTMMSKTPSQKRMLLKYFSVVPFILLVSLVFTNQSVQAEINKVDNILHSNNETGHIVTDTIPVTREIFKVVEEMPEFPGGQSAMLDVIIKNMKYPKQAFNAKAEGTNVISFIVEPDGTMSSLELVRDAGLGMGEESIRLANFLKNNYTWKPGLQRGKPVAVKMMLPLKFKLETKPEIIEKKSKKIIYQSGAKLLFDDQGNSFTLDTVVTYDPVTEEEEIMIIRNDGPLKENDKNKSIKADNILYHPGNKDNEFYVDTIVTFDPDKFTEEVKIVRTPKNKIFEAVDEMPEFPGGQQAMLKYIFTNLKYPALARENKIQGMAVIGFVVEKDGSLSNLEVLKNPGYGTGEEALRVLQKMAEEFTWKPGKKMLRDVRVSMKLPIKYKLDSEAIKEDIQLESDESKSPLIVLYDNRENEITRSTVDLAKDKLMNIDPEDIERINVLKNEAAAELFGDEGAHGVIQIYLKSGPIKHPKVVKERVTVAPKSLKLDEISIYPNPTSDFIRVDIDRLEQDAQIMIYTLDGRRIYQQPVSASTQGISKNFDMTGTKAGIYVVAIIQGDMVSTNMVVKK